MYRVVLSSLQAVQGPRRYLYRKLFHHMATSIFSSHEYIEYRPGNLNLIISVPHGGRLKPEHIPNRDAGCCVDGQVIYSHDYESLKDPELFPVKSLSDLRTIHLAMEVIAEIQKRKGGTPHLIICHLCRSKLDVNRDLEEGTFGVPLAVDEWHAYHSFIQQAKSTIKRQGLIVDLHGQNHSEGWVELGYAIPIIELNTKDFTPELTSVRSAFLNSSQKMQSIHELISGPFSLGGLMWELSNSFKVVPSPSISTPGLGNYYTGGYITETHGSKNGGLIDSIQIECPSSARFLPGRKDFGKVLAGAVCKFLDLHYK